MVEFPCKKCVVFAICKNIKNIKCDILYDKVVIEGKQNKITYFSYTQAQQILTSMRSLGRETILPIGEDWP